MLRSAISIKVTLCLFTLCLSASKITEAATSRSEIYDELNLSHQGRIGIYETRNEIVEELRAEIVAITKKRDQLNRTYKSGHPRMIAIAKQLDVLGREMNQARQATIDTAASLTIDDRTILIEQFRTELELETVRKRAELASLRTRYKEKFPSVIEKRIELETLNHSLEAFYKSDIVNLASNLEEIERLQIQTAIFKKAAELQKLKNRYLDKHPTMIQIRDAIQALQSELDSLPASKRATPLDENDNDRLTKTSKNSASTLDKHEATVALLKEEIGLVEAHIKRLESATPSTLQNTNRQRLERLDLLRLQQELASKEGNRADQIKSLGKQQQLLEQLVKTATHPDASYQYKRELIAVKRARIEISE